ncbi:MAG: Beta-lactamase class C-like and penicillin binding proteins (PBPs) superfamily, partial [uncultured Acidimicrobiales bacterium]
GRGRVGRVRRPASRPARCGRRRGAWWCSGRMALVRGGRARRCEARCLVTLLRGVRRQAVHGDGHRPARGRRSAHHRRPGSPVVAGARAVVGGCSRAPPARAHGRARRLRPARCASRLRRRAPVHDEGPGGADHHVSLGARAGNDPQVQQPRVRAAGRDRRAGDRRTPGELRPAAHLRAAGHVRHGVPRRRRSCVRTRLGGRRAAGHHRLHVCGRRGTGLDRHRSGSMGRVATDLAGGRPGARQPAGAARRPADPRCVGHLGALPPRASHREPRGLDGRLPVVLRALQGPRGVDRRAGQHRPARRRGLCRPYASLRGCAPRRTPGPHRAAVDRDARLGRSQL